MSETLKKLKKIIIVHKKLWIFTSYTEDDVDIGPLDNMDTEKRNKLFERGINFDKEGKKTAALKCYMGCLQGLQHDTKFPLLPVCLRNVSVQGWYKIPTSTSLA